MLEGEIRETHFFNGLPSDARARFLSVAHQTVFPPGVIFREGERHEKMYVVESGLVQLSMHVPGRGSVPILSIGPGDLLAWSAALGVHAPVMTATAVAMEATTTRAIGRAELEDLCQSEAETGSAIWRQISRSLSRRLVATRLQLLDLFAEQGTPLAAPSSLSISLQIRDSSNSNVEQNDAG